MPYIYSTRTKSHRITNWETFNDGRLPRKCGEILIHGGANLPNDILVTPKGVVTKVSEEELELLKKNHVFDKHLKNGTFKIQKSESRDVDKAVKDMTPKDSAAPLVPDDYPDDSQPIVGNKDEDEEPAPRRRGRPQAGA